jgi:Kef-type K+ transport system membrane component KefB
MSGTVPFCVSLLLPADNDNARVVLSMLVVFVSAKLLAEIAERLKQPAVVGEILAGVIIGPSVLGWIKPDGFLSLLAELGLMFLLFGVGLELKDFDLSKVGFVATLVAILGVAVPFACGWGLMSALGAPQIEAIFVGAAMVATSVGITARVLAAKGLLDQRASRIILAAAVIDDVLGLLVLSVANSMARGSINLMELGLSAGMAIGFVVLVVKWGTRTMDRIVPQAEQKLRGGGGEFTLAIALLFGLSLLAVYAGVAAIVGAFLAGMVLANSTGKRVHDMAAGVAEFLVPFFLVGVGLHLDLSVFAKQSTIVMALVILVVACLSKFLGCFLGTYRIGVADAVRVGVGMIPRGEVGMVVAQIGLLLGVIPPATYGVVVFMSIATTIVAPPLLNLAYRGVPGTPTDTEDVSRIG